MIRFAAMIGLAIGLATPGFSQDTPSPAGAAVSFVGLEDGATMTSPLTVTFGITGMEVAPADTLTPNTGHHHLLIDRAPFGEGEYGAEEFTLAIPKDEHHMHFGKGQTEVVLDLAPGPHTLQLVLGDQISSVGFATLSNIPSAMLNVIQIGRNAPEFLMEHNAAARKGKAGQNTRHKRHPWHVGCAF